MIGIAVHSRSCAADLDAVAVGQHEVDDRRVRRAHGRLVERLRGGRRRIDLEAGVAQDHAQRAQDLRLVVADEDALGHDAARPTGRRLRGGSSDGNSTTKLVPCPGSDSTETRPPLASTNPRTIARPSPEPRWPEFALPAR